MIKTLVSTYQHNSNQTNLTNSYQIYMNMLANTATSYSYMQTKSSELSENPVNFSMSSTSSFETSGTSASETSFAQHQQLSPRFDIVETDVTSTKEATKRKTKINFGSISDLINWNLKLYFSIVIYFNYF